MKKLLTAFSCISLLISGCAFSQRQTITLGIFAGSAWEVHESAGYELIDDVIARFEEAHPGVDVVYESGIRMRDYEAWLKDKIIMGQMPDVFVMLGKNLGEYASLGVLENLDPYIRSDSEVQTDIFFSAALEAGKYQYSQYALPLLMNPMMMFVNVSLLEKEGVTMTNGTWTVDEFEQLIRKVTRDTDGDGSIDQYGCIGYDWLDLADAYGLSVFDDAGTQADLEQAKPVLEQYGRMKPYMGKAQDRDLLLESGKAAFSPMSYAEYITYNPYPWKIKKYTDFQWMCIQMPQTSHADTRYTGDTMLMGMSAKGRHSQLAWELMKMFCVDEKNQTDLLLRSQGFCARRLPSNTIFEFLKDSGLSAQTAEAIMNEKGKRTQFAKYEQARESLSELMEKAVSENSDYDLALAQAEDTLHDFLQK